MDGYHFIQEAKTRFGTTYDVLDRFVKSASHDHDILTAKVGQGEYAAIQHSVKFSLLTQTTSTNFYTTVIILLAVNEVFFSLRKMQIVSKSSSAPQLHNALPPLENAKNIVWFPLLAYLQPIWPQRHTKRLVLWCTFNPIWCVTSLLDPGLCAFEFVSGEQERDSLQRSGQILLQVMKGDGIQRSIQHSTSFDLSSECDFSRSPLDSIAYYRSKPVLHLAEKQLNAPLEPIQYWLGKQKACSNLAVAALRVLVIPLTSLPSGQELLEG